MKEDKNEKIRKALINFFEGWGDKTWDNGIKYSEVVAWLEKQKPLDEEKVLIGARKDVALSIMNYLDDNTKGMCLSNMECEDLENAVIDSDWGKVYRYMQKKLEKQGEQKPCMIQWKGDNLKEVLDFTGKDKNFDKWFKSFEDYERYVHEHNNTFKLFNEDGSHYEVPVGAWIVKTPDGYNVASKANKVQNYFDKKLDSIKNYFERKQKKL